MNKTLLFASFLTVGSVAVHGQTPAPVAPASPLSITATASVVSQYMFRGQRLNGPGFQPSIEVGAGDATLGAWGNFPLEDKVPDSSDPEIDLYGSYKFSLAENLSLAPGFTSYHYPRAPRGAGLYRHTFEPNIALTYSMEGFAITPKIYYDTVLDGATYELTGACAIPLTAIGSELDFTATIGTFKLTDFAKDTSPAVKSWGDYWLVGVAMPFQLAANQKLTIGAAYTEGRDAYIKEGSLPRVANSLAIGRGVVSISYAYSF